MIIHVDMDAFYASVEERDNPALVGQPLVVGGSPNARGVVAAANYAAREYGIHSAMPMRTAHKLCDSLVRLPVRMDHYAAVSRQLHVIFQSFTPLVEPLSLDEAFLDVSGSTDLFGSPAHIGRELKRRIASELSLVASVGVAPNKFLAKLASDIDKPDGFVVIAEPDIDTFLEPLPVSRLWGVGKVTNRQFRQLGIETIGQLKAIPQGELELKLGSLGGQLWHLAHGVDERLVVPDRQAKFISNETTFPEDITEPEVLRSWLLGLTDQVAVRLRNSSLAARKVQLKIRYEDFQTYTRSVTLQEPTDVTSELWTAVADLLDNRLPSRRLQVRLIGMGVSGLEPRRSRQARLFDSQDRGQARRLDEATDGIRDRFGKDALKRGLAPIETPDVDKQGGQDE